MLTVEDVRQLDDEQARDTFKALGAEVYGKDRWKREFCRDVDMGARQVHVWLEDGKRPPAWAILLLDTRAHARQISDTLRRLSQALSDARDLSDTL